MDGTMSFKSKRTDLTYVIESCTHLPSGTKILTDEELTDLWSRESRMTFGMCNGDSKHSVKVEKTLTSLVQPIEACSSNVKTSGREAERETFRISRSCEGGRCNFDTGEARRNDIALGYSLLAEARKQDDEGESFVHEGFSN